MVVPTKYRQGGVTSVTETGSDRTTEDAVDEYVGIGREFGRFMRSMHHFQQTLHAHVPDRHLDRAAYMILGRIAGGGPVRLSALAGELCVDPSTVSRQVAALEAAGLLVRTPDPKDRRASLIAASPAGAEVFASNRARWIGALRELLADWTPAERREFARLFARLNEAILARAPASGSAGAGTGGTGRETR